jgi:hypothetical protein
MAYFMFDLKKVRSIATAAFLPLPLAFAISATAQSPAPAPPPEDELTFVNGDHLTGKLTRVTGDSVLFHSDVAGDITVPLAKVKELHTQGAYALLKQGEPLAVSKKATPGKIEVADGNVTATPPSAAPLTVPAASVAYVIDEETFNKNLKHKQGFLDGWDGSANLGTSFSQATTHGGTLAGGIALVRQVPMLSFLNIRNKTLLNFQETYGVLTTPGFLAGGAINPATGKPDDAKAKTSIMHADAERDEYISKRFYALGTTAFDHNYAQSLDLQQIYGGGFGWTPLQQANQQLDLKADVHYEKQKFFGDVGNQNLIGSTFSENYRRTLPLKMVLTQTLALLPAWNNLNAYAGNGSVMLVAPLFRRLGVNFTGTDSFINNPVPGYQKNSFTFTTGLTYTLH